MAAGKVILYFENQEDAMHFTLAAGSLMSGEKRTGTTGSTDLARELSRASRICVKGTINPAGWRSPADGEADQ
jgi:hypothetical protein